MTFDDALVVTDVRRVRISSPSTMRSRRWPTVDERKGRVIELRFFGGLSVEETARVLKVSADTVMRDWKLAKAWLQRELHDREAGR